MKKKLLVTLIIISFVIPMTLPIVAAIPTSYFNDKLSELNNIINDIEELRNQYDEDISSYEDVVNMLSPEVKDKALNLTSDLTDEASITADVNSIIAELESLHLSRATELSDKIEDMKSDAKTIADESKLLIEDIEDNYSDLSINQIASLMDKSKELLVSLGGIIDKTAEYNSLMDDITSVNTSLNSFNANFNSFTELYEDELTAVIKPNLAKKMMNKLIDEDMSAALTEVKNALIALETDQGDDAAAEMTILINEMTDIDEGINAIANGSIENYIYFTENQINGINEEVQNVADEYVEFLNNMINSFVKPSYNALIEDLYDYDIDTAIDKIDDGIDEILTYETRIRNKKNELINNPPSYIKILVLLGNTDIDVTEYIDNSFAPNIEYLRDKLIEEIEGYIEHVQASIVTERTTIIENESDTVLTKQTTLAAVTTRNIATKAKFEALETKIRQKLADKDMDSEDIDNALTFASNIMYNIYDVSILNNVEAGFKLENTKFTYDENKQYIIARGFINIDEVTNITGLDADAFTYNGIVSSKIKTKSSMMITMNPDVFEIYTFVVKADVNGDGRKNISDLILTIDAALRLNNLDDASLTAADMNSNNNINISDVIMVIDSILGR